MIVLPDVLFVTHRVPYPPDKGDRIRTYHILKFLARHARVHLAALADEPVPEETLQVLNELTARLAIVPLGRSRWLHGLRSVALGGSISAGVFWSGALARSIRGWAVEANFRSALVSASSLVDYMKGPAFSSVRRIVDIVDVDSQKWLDYARASGIPKRWLYSLEARRLRTLEREVCGWADGVTLVSDGEARMLAEISGTPNVHAITNGVDLEYYHPGEGEEAGRLVFVGALDYLPNVDGITWFAREVWPGVRERLPQVRLSVVGRRPVASVRELSRVPGIDVIGQVPDVRPYLARSEVVVAPLRIARGLQNKVLEALSAGKPVVASGMALAGFGHRDELPALGVLSPTEWVETLSALLADPARRTELGRRGREFAERRHDWNHCLSPLLPLMGLSPQEDA